MSTEKNLTNLVINKVESQDVYDYMKANSLINADELYVVAGGDQIATETDDGLMSSEDKIKLDNIEENANNYIHPAYTPRSNGLYKVTIDSTGHVSNVTAAEKDDITGLGIPAQDTTYSEVTTATSGLMSSSDKIKLNNIAEGAEVNQNAFSNVTIGSTTISADSKTDTLTLVAGNNITITPDATNDKITIAATDTTYGAAGTSLGLVQSGGDVTISSGIITVNDDSHNHIIANVDGLQAELDSKVDKVTGKGLSTNDLTNALKSNYDTAYTHSQQAHAPADAEKNVIVGVQKNGTDLTVNATTRKVNITVPTKTSELTNDSSFVTTIDLDAKADAPFKPTGKSYLTFSSPNSFTLAVGDATKHWDGTLEYFAEDKTWTVWDGTTTLSAVDNDGEYVLYLRGIGNTKITGSISNDKWVLTGSDISCIGNIENLLDYATVESGNHPTMANFCYGYMFEGCTSLTQAPALPATTLADHCYERMFEGCTSLTQAPALPATTLAGFCYACMFNGCTSLTQAPALPATTLANRCYDTMFTGCTSLTQAPALPATTLANYCYHSMFNGCTSLTQAPALPATTLASNCYYSMFNGCTSLTQAPALPATTLANQCYERMFKGCTSLTQAPVLPATTLAEYCYTNMFTGCTSLTQAPALPATTLARSCYHSMFTGCTSLTQAPALPATTLAEYCYYSMFEGCTSLKLSSTQTGEYTQEYCIPSSGTGTTANSALTNMFSSTGGTFAGTPAINTTCYFSTNNMIVRETEVATLNGYVGSMIGSAENGQYVVTTAGTGAAYTATVPGITSLTAGASFIMVPHTASTSTAPTLNVNGLGAKTIKRRISSIATTLQSGYSSSWLASGKPFRVIYDGTYWITDGHEQPVAADLYGTLAVSKGGTGATTAEDARTNLGAAPAYTYGTEDLVAGTSELATGTLYFVYE